MRKTLCFTILALMSACRKDAETKTHAQVAVADSPRRDVRTETDLSAIDLTDTVEDPAYAAPGEELAQRAGATLLGSAAPVVSMTTIDGATISLSSIYGQKPVYIKFWATWCIPCRQQMQAFEATYQALGDNMQFVALNIGLSDDEASVRAFRDTYSMTMPIVMDDDGRLAELFHLRVTPQHVLIGRDARFAYIGHAENATLHTAIDDVLRRASPSSTTTHGATEPNGTEPNGTADDRPEVFKVGDTVPALTVTTSSGEPHPLRGAGPNRIRAIVFFSSWCEWYLQKTRPGTAHACARVRQSVETLIHQKSNIDWLGVAGGPWATESDLADYRTNNQVTLPIGIDASGALFRAFGIRDIPTVVVIDSAGTVIQIIKPSTSDLTEALSATRTK
jgi:peroxiredoxin